MPCIKVWKFWLRWYITARRSFNSFFQIMSFHEYFLTHHIEFRLSMDGYLEFFTNTAVVQPVWATLARSFSSWRVLVHVVVARRDVLRSAQIASNEVVENRLGHFDWIVIWCVAVSVQEGLNIICFTNPRHNEIDIVLSQRVSELVCGSPSSSAWTLSSCLT